MKDLPYKIIKTFDKNVKKNIYNVEIFDSFSLFRFRTVNNYNINALFGNEIWASNPNTFNDPYDSSIYISKKVFKSTIDHIVNSHKNINDKKPNKYDINDLAKIVINKLKDLYLIVSFTTEVTNEILWAHYADEAKGYALEYDYYDLFDMTSEYISDWYRPLLEHKETTEEEKKYLKEVAEMQKYIYPIIYQNSKFDASELLENYNDENSKIPIELRITAEQTMVTSKYKAWSYEKEWRIIVPNNYDKLYSHYRIGKVKPKALYLGEKIEYKDLIVLLNYAKNENIKVFLMNSNVFSKKKYLSFRELKTEDINEILAK